MNRRLVSLAAVCAVLPAFLVGCASTPAPTVEQAERSAPVPAVTDSPDTSSADYGFDSAVSSHGVPAESYGSARTIAHAFCSTLDAGEDFDTAAVHYLDMAQDDGVTADQIGAIVGAGVTAYCPEYGPELDAFVAAGS